MPQLNAHHLHHHLPWSHPDEVKFLTSHQIETLANELAKEALRYLEITYQTDLRLRRYGKNFKPQKTRLGFSVQEVMECDGLHRNFRQVLGKLHLGVKQVLGLDAGIPEEVTPLFRPELWKRLFFWVTSKRGLNPHLVKNHLAVLFQQRIQELFREEFSDRETRELKARIKWTDLGTQTSRQRVWSDSFFGISEHRRHYLYSGLVVTLQIV